MSSNATRLVSKNYSQNIHKSSTVDSRSRPACLSNESFTTIYSSQNKSRTRFPQQSSVRGRAESYSANSYAAPEQGDIVRPSTRSGRKSQKNYTYGISSTCNNDYYLLKRDRGCNLISPTKEYSRYSSYRQSAMDTQTTSRRKVDNNDNRIDDSCRYPTKAKEYNSSKYSSSSADDTSSLGKGFSSLSVKSSNSGKVGLKNIGNTCFMNSIVQCLSNTKKLRDYCLEKKYKNDVNYNTKMKGKLVEAFSKVILDIWSSSSSSISPNSLKSQVQTYSSRFSGYEQHDSQEFFHVLLEGLHEEINKVEKKTKKPIPDKPHWSEEERSRETWNWYKNYNNSLIVDLFVGQLKSTLRCSHCNHLSTIFDPYWDLSLPIPKVSRYSISSKNEPVNIMQCLEDFTREEVLDGNERPACEKCKTHRKMSKKFTIYDLPEILVLHLKRFNEGLSYRQKLSTNVIFPLTLEFRQESIARPQTTYSLYAVSNHSGSCYGGHYTAYCKLVDTDDWYHFNDSLVSSMPSSSVQTKEAYVLFYEKTSSSRRQRRPRTKL